MKKCFLVVGLGNPEGKYFNTWHNLGFLAAESFANSQECQFKKKGNQLLAETVIGENKVYILKPLTYMNLSGQAVLAVVRKYKIAAEDIIVFCDDIYIDIGNVRITKGGSGGGHKGLHSVNELLKTTEYIKIRIGAKPVKEIKCGTADYVLSKIGNDVREKVNAAVINAADAAGEILSGSEIAAVQSKYNAKNAGEKC